MKKDVLGRLFLCLELSEYGVKNKSALFSSWEDSKTQAQDQPNGA